MRFAITLPGVLLAFALLALSPAGAQEQGGLFAARRVPVDATAESAAKARDQAIAEGQRRALDIVLRRLTPGEAHPRLPAVDEAALAALVESLQVEREKTSARRYIAELTVEFRPRGVRDLLRGAGVPFVEQRAPLLLLAPVLEVEDGRLVLFDDPNPWRDAWRRALADRASLAPVALPLGDLEDVATIAPEEALAGDDAKLSALARRYGAARWAVAAARPTQDGGFTVTLLRPTGSEVERARAEPDGEPEAAMTAAAARIADRLDEEWKRQATALAVSGEEGQLSARAAIGGLADWLALRERLGRSPAVRAVDVLAISARDAQLMLRHVGTPEQLAQALALNDVELVAEQGFWRLALKGRQAVR